MDQNNNNATGGTGRRQSPFEKFKARIKELSERQNSVFLDIMKRIDERKTAEARQKLNEIRDSEDTE